MGDILDPPGLSLLAATWPPIGLCSGSSLNRPVMLDLDPEPDIAPLRSQENSTLSVQSFVFSVTQFRFKGNQIHGKSGNRSPTRSGLVEEHALRLVSADAGNVTVRAQCKAHVVGGVQRLYAFRNDIVEEVAVLKKSHLFHRHKCVHSTYYSSIINSSNLHLGEREQHVGIVSFPLDAGRGVLVLVEERVWHVGTANVPNVDRHVESDARTIIVESGDNINQTRLRDSRIIKGANAMWTRGYCILIYKVTWLSAFGYSASNGLARRGRASI